MSVCGDAAPARHASRTTPLHTRLKRLQVMLMSRDEMSMLVVSYADLKRCVEGAFGELSARASQVRSRPLARR